ncbi:hypothetical protein [Bacillus velezensis]|uniref:hypothetical protein n=1 Tax=Bacillus velezensis TaxID=492670 RepID=UPI0013F14C54|nr:hypothetical protein [Bacillus velezensis]
MKKKLAAVTVTRNNQLFFKRRKAGLDRCMLYTAGVSIRNSVRPSLRKKRKTRKEPDAENTGSFCA